MDLLKACQRAGLVRIERDRRGGLRVFQGTSLAGVTPARPAVNLPQPDVEDEIVDATPIEVQSGVPLASNNGDERDESGLEAAEPIPIDTTAELLGRAKARKPRLRAARPVAAALGARKTAAKKPAARRTARPKKTAASS
jgi:hypothetical protein